MYVYIYEFFPTKNMQNPPPPPLRSDYLYIKDEECVESNGKLYFRFFRFSVFELWLIAFIIHGNTPGVPLTKKKWAHLICMTLN